MKSSATSGPKTGPTNKSQHITFCVRPGEKEQIEVLAESMDTKASPLIHRMLFHKNGALRQLPSSD